VVLCVLSLQAFVALRPQLASFLPGQAVQPQVDYAAAMRGDDRERMSWEASVETAAFVWDTVDDGRRIAVWWAPRSDDEVPTAASMLLYYRHAIATAMPQLDAAGAQALLESDTGWIAMYGEDLELLDAATAAADDLLPVASRECSPAAGDGEDIAVSVCLLEVAPQ